MRTSPTSDFHLWTFVRDERRDAYLCSLNRKVAPIRKRIAKHFLIELAYRGLLPRRLVHFCFRLFGLQEV